MSPLLLMAVGVGALSTGWTAWVLASQVLGRFPVTLQTFPSIRLPEKLGSPIVLFSISLLTALACCVLFSPWIAFLPLIAGIKSARETLSLLSKRFADRKKQMAYRELFPMALGMAVQALKTGQTVPQTLSYIAKECPSPLRQELSQVVSEMGLGASTEQAISKMADRNQEILEFAQFLESYRISRTTGANLAHLLQVLLEGLEEKNRIMRKMEAMTAQARLSGLMMGLLPLLLTGIFFWMDPTLIRPLFTERMGWGILLLAVFLETVGFLWIRQLLRVEV